MDLLYGNGNPFRPRSLIGTFELAVIDAAGDLALVFPCRRTAEGWIDATTKRLLGVWLAALDTFGCRQTTHVYLLKKRRPAREIL